MKNDSQPSNRPNGVLLMELGRYLREERMKIGLTSAEAFVQYLEELTGIPHDTVTARNIYNIESAKTIAKIEAMPFAAISCFAENLFNQKPSVKYLVNPRTNKPFTSNELIAIAYGWMDLNTGEKFFDCSLF